ncbi:MAG: hypothetical protein R6U64_04425 [Bacteroidales bacterium]
MEARFSMLDAFGAIYWVDDNGLNRQDDLRSEPRHYSNLRYGPISHVDVSDPLHILVFYQHSGMIEFLDKNLAPKDIPGFPPAWMQADPPSLVTTSVQQGFWAFFPQTMSLKRYDSRMNLQAENENLQQQLPQFAEPLFMVEAQGQLFVATTNHNLFVFDSFGNFLFTLKGPESDRFQVVGNNLVSFSGNKMRIFNFIKSSETVYLLPEGNIQQGFIRGASLLLQTSNSINKYLLPMSLF